jgi:hypothetical protein
VCVSAEAACIENAHAYAPACTWFLIQLQLKNHDFKIGFLVRVSAEAGDIENARALFERALVEPENSSSPALWRAYALFEWDQGELVASAQVSWVMLGVLTEVPPSYSSWVCTCTEACHLW